VSAPAPATLGRRWRLLLLGGGALFLLSGCRVDVDVATRVEDDGSGIVEVTVTLDEEAAAQVPDLAEQLRVEDLEAAGWEVTGPDDAEGGTTVVRASKPFANADEAAGVLAEVGGENGILQDMDLSRSRSIARTEYSLDGTLDLSPGLAAFSDPALTELLAEQPVGFDPADLEEDFGQPVADMLGFTLTLDVPVGDIDAEGAEVASDGGRTQAVWTATLGDEPVPIDASGSEWDLVGLGWIGGAVLSALVLVVVLVRRRRRGRRVVVTEEREDARPSVSVSGETPS